MTIHDPSASSELRTRIAKALFAHPVSNGAGRVAPDIYDACDSAAGAILALLPSADDIDDAISGAIPDDIPGWRERYTQRAVNNVLDLIGGER